MAYYVDSTIIIADIFAGKNAAKDQICTSSKIPKPIESETPSQHMETINYEKVHSDRIKVSQDKLTVYDLALVQRKVWDGRAKWYNIGLELGLIAPTLEAIKESCHHDVDKCFRATLQEWLSNGDLCRSWSHLAHSLRASPVGLGDLAEQLLIYISDTHAP